MINEELGGNVTDFAEAKARLEQSRKRGLFLQNNKSTLALSVLLYGVKDSIEKGEINLNEEGSLALRRLLPEFTKLMTSTSVVNMIHISRIDINTIGDWATSVNVTPRKKKNDLYVALLDLNKEFVRVGGPDNPEFKEAIESIVKRK